MGDEDVETSLKDGFFCGGEFSRAITADKRQMSHNNAAEKTAGGANHNNTVTESCQG